MLMSANARGSGGRSPRHSSAMLECPDVSPGRRRRSSVSLAPELQQQLIQQQQFLQSHPPPMARATTIGDQFDEYLYTSQHIGSAPPVGMTLPIISPPDVNIEVPSDSDSSRRPSHIMTMSNASSYNNFDDDDEEEESAFYCGPSAPKRGGGRRPSVSVERGPFQLSPNKSALDRRSSYAGLPPKSPTSSCRRESICTSNTLGVPMGRCRGSSLPGNFNLNEEDMYRLRNFSIAGKKVINRGDSLKARSSNHSINSAGLSSPRNSGDEADGGSLMSSRRESLNQRAATSASASSGPPPPPPVQFSIAMLGAMGVGKTALTTQFLSSENANTYEDDDAEVSKVVCLNVDGKEFQMNFIDEPFTDIATTQHLIDSEKPDGFMVVFAVDEAASLQQAKLILDHLKAEDILERKAVILVANKTDLVRSRIVSVASGKSCAVKYGCKYIEASSGINHNIDELLVGMLSQVQLRIEANERGGNKSKLSKKVFNLFERIWNMNDSKAKSCSNLYVL